MVDAELAAMSAVELRERLAQAELDVAAAGPEDAEWARSTRAEVRAALDLPPVDAEPEAGDTVIELRNGVPYIGVQAGPRPTRKAGNRG